MPDTKSRILRIAAARADFLESGSAGAAGVPGTLAASWERSQAAGVDTDQPHANFTQDLDRDSLLSRCARPVIDRLGTDVADFPLVIALTDQRARVVQRIDCSTGLGRLLDRVEFAPGFSYTESTMGTNGVGTVLESGEPFDVIGPEHFIERLIPFACTGSPIIDPVTGRVEGVLDISTLTETWSPLLHTLVRSAAKDIGHNLLLDRCHVQQALYDTYLRADARASRQAVFAFGDALLIANAQAQAMFDSDEQSALRDHATLLMNRRDQVSDTVEMAHGRRVHLRGTRIWAGHEVAGIVLIVDQVAAGHDRHLRLAERVLPRVAVSNRQTSAIASGLRLPYDSVIAGQSSNWIRACRELTGAMERQQPTIIVGETGAGKFTLVAEIFHRCHPQGRSLSVDAAELGSDEDSTDGGTVIADHSGPTMVIVRNIDQVSTEGVERLEGLFDTLCRSSGGSWFVATLSDSSLRSDLPFHTLLPYFETSVTVPPLRARREDLAGITGSLLRTLAPGRKVRTSPDLERLIARYSWPRNISQLRDALAHALRQRPVGELQAEDLPAYCHTSSRRTLTPLESAERDAIVTALQDHHGQRVAAAQHLGMSRSSLYRKLKTYGITV